MTLSMEYFNEKIKQNILPQTQLKQKIKPEAIIKLKLIIKSN